MNRLCASGLNAVGEAARAIRSGEIDLAIAGGVESMTRAPLVMGKAAEAFQRTAEVYDTTIGWRFINPLMKAQRRRSWETGESVPRVQMSPGWMRWRCARSSAGKTMADGYFAEEIVGLIPAGAGPSWSTRTSIRAPTPRPSSSPSCAPRSAIPAR